MIVISCMSQKGGSGKTTFVANMAVAAIQAGRQVAVIDADPQASLRNWKSLRGPGQPRFAAIRESHLRRFPELLEKARGEDIDLVLVDTAPRLSQENRYIAEHSDVLVVPVKPRTFDFWAMEETLSVISDLRERMPVIGVISEAPYARGIAEASAVRSMFEAMTRMGIQPCPYPIRRREDYDLAVSDGLGVLEYAPNGKSALEIARIWSWLESAVLSGQTAKGASGAGPVGADPARANLAGAGKSADGQAMEGQPS